jgi:serine/threonine-protein kinase
MANIVPGQIIQNRYRVIEFIGSGGMADVYKVYDKSRRVYLAMKILKGDLAEDRDFIRRFLREGRWLDELQHSNIVRFYGLEEDQQFIFMLMDFIDGRTLKTEIFRDKKPFIKEKIWLIMNSVCKALSYAHQSGFVHCDVKPANIMIDRLGQVFLTDFGIAQELDATTSSMLGFGAPAYMSPEQVKQQELTPRSDIYSLGVVLYEMLTGGRRPFDGARAEVTGTASHKVQWEQVRLQPPSPRIYNPNISPELENIVMRCLEKRPSKRYQSTMELLANLQRALQPLDPEILNACLVMKGGGGGGGGDNGGEQRQNNFIQWLQNIANHIPVKAVQEQPLLLLTFLLIPLILGIFLFPKGEGPTPPIAEVVPTMAQSWEENPTAETESLPQDNSPQNQSNEANEVVVEENKASSPNSSSTPPSCSRAGEEWVDPTDGATLVCIPSGDFIMGSKDTNLIAKKKAEELLFEKIYLDAYWIDQTEVSVEQFQKFVNDTDYITDAEKDHSGHTMNVIENTWSINSKADWLHPHGTSEEEKSDHPVTQVSWNDAVAYCEWAGRTLPTEAQWEKAARGTNGYSFPFEYDRQYVYCLNSNFSDQSLGAKWSKDGCDDGYKYTAPIYEDFYCRSYLGECASVLDNPYNLYNMLGNVTEWVRDDWNGKYYRSISSNNPVYQNNSDQKCMRGGSWGSMPEKTRPTNRDYDQIDAAYDTLGFRCAYQ